MTYFDSDYEKPNDFENTILVNSIISNEIHCRRCRTVFNSNNLLYKHFRANSNDCKRITFEKNFIKKVHINMIQNAFSLIHFKINSNQDLNIEYDFRE